MKLKNKVSLKKMFNKIEKCKLENGQFQHSTY